MTMITFIQWRYDPALKNIGIGSILVETQCTDQGKLKNTWVHVKMSMVSTIPSCILQNSFLMFQQSSSM